MRATGTSGALVFANQKEQMKQPNRLLWEGGLVLAVPGPGFLGDFGRPGRSGFAFAIHDLQHNPNFIGGTAWVWHRDNIDKRSTRSDLFRYLRVQFYKDSKPFSGPCALGLCAGRSWLSTS